MSQIAFSELERYRKRLDYFNWLKAKSGSDSSVVDKWIAIYRERTNKLEREINRAKSRTEARQH
ncbi:MAG: hypothetical protein A2428_06525 [Bdellovibrionales bacterium RIFOXYC1_FULL_54_43]|nr:MAG: hypothetical protein A2428_06525 [Bdellovibrionales bacterium RIFOXYC1_FULL_54_43]OFZ85115.1 MAG: hypothetical protein A2603_07220 [Bdellovibrionales bacterium RIFOXYD1_FULL_55_31]